MDTPRSRQAARLRARRRRAQRRARRIAILSILGAFGVITLLLTAFGSSGSQPQVAYVIRPASTSSTPGIEPVATVSNLSIQLPVAQGAVTAVGFHASTTGALALQPLGRQINEGLLARLWHKIAGSPTRSRAWYQLGGGSGGPATAALNVGAPVGTTVYAPVTGTVTSISDTILSGARHGSRIDIRPTGAPSVIVSISHVDPDPALAVGSPVTVRTDKIGSVADVAKVERQSLARHTNDEGNNVEIEAHPAPASLP